PLCFFFASAAAFLSIACRSVLAARANFFALVGFSAALASLLPAAWTLLSMKVPSAGGRPPGQSTRSFSWPRQSRAVAHAGSVVVVGPAGVVVVVAWPTGVVVVVGVEPGRVVVVDSFGAATNAKGDRELTVTHAYLPSMRVFWSTNALPTKCRPASLLT